MKKEENKTKKDDASQLQQPQSKYPKKKIRARQISQRKNGRDGRNMYLDKDEFKAEISKWRESAEKVEDRVMHDKLALMILSIPQHMLQSKLFCGYEHHLKEDMTMNAYVKIVKNLKNFKPEYGTSAFKYFSRCCYFAFLETIMKYYKHKNMIEELTAAAQHRLKSLGLDAARDLYGFDDYE